MAAYPRLISLILAFSLGPVCLLTASCTTRPYQEQLAQEERHLNLTELRYRFTLDAQCKTAERILAAKKVFIFPYDPQVALDDPIFKQAAHILYVTLEDLGYGRAVKPEEADV